MKHKTKRKTLNRDMRSLHRNIGFFVVGLIIIFSINGIVLIYRNTEFLKKEKFVEKTLDPNLEASELGKVLYLRNFKVLKEEEEMVYFQDGTYNKVTGDIKYSSKELPAFLSKFNKLHMSSSIELVHWASLIFGILLMFLAISSFWMYKPQTRMFRRRVFIAFIGVTFAVILLFL